MEKLIYFGGTSGQSAFNQKSSSANKIFQEFGQYVMTVWADQNQVPESAEALSAFDVASLIPKYRAYIAAGGQVNTDKGATLEQIWLGGLQLFLHECLVCLLNSHQPRQPTARITRKALLEPSSLIRTMQRSFSAHLDASKSIPEQQNRMKQEGHPAPANNLLVYDGEEVAHCVVLEGIDKRTSSFIYFDPWPGRSLLCQENNAAGVTATPCPSGERLWLINPDDLERVVYAFMMPQTLWRRLING